MKLKTMSAISPVIFDSLVKENFFTKQVWNTMANKDGSLSIRGLEGWLEKSLILFELDDYDDEEDIYWRLKIGQTGEPNIRELPYPYHYMETHAHWIIECIDLYADPDTKDRYKRYFSSLSPEQFEKFRLGCEPDSN